MLATLDPASTLSPAALAKPLALSEAAQGRVLQARNLHELLENLCEADLHVDAARLLVRALPKRYAVAWVCECFRQDAGREPFPDAEQGCIRSAESWLADDNEAARQAASDLAETANYETAASWLAAAAGWSGGSLAPPGYTVVEPGEFLTADACFAALCLLAARDPAAFKPRLSGWLQRAFSVFSSDGPQPAEAKRKERS